MSPPHWLACLHRGSINTTYRLLEHTYRELIWHSEITPEALYDVLSMLRRHGETLKATTNAVARPLNEGDLEVFRLRVVEGRRLKETGEEVGIGVERVRQVLTRHFGLRGEPPAVKVRHRGSLPDCAQAGRAIERLRCEKGLTIKHLVADAGLSAEHLERIEDGLRDPTWTTLQRLAVGLDTTAALLAYAIETEPCG